MKQTNITDATYELISQQTSVTDKSQYVKVGRQQPQQNVVATCFITYENYNNNVENVVATCFIRYENYNNNVDIVVATRLVKNNH